MNDAVMTCKKLRMLTSTCHKNRRAYGNATRWARTHVFELERVVLETSLSLATWPESR